MRRFLTNERFRQWGRKGARHTNTANNELIIEVGELLQDVEPDARM